LDLNNGAITYHLDILEKFGYIESYKDGMRRCYVPCGNGPVHVKTNCEEKLDLILGVLARNPGATPKRMAQKIGMTARKLSYYLKAAKENGAVRAEKNGRHVAYYPI
jgi:predicted transcriptional regulator